MPPPPLLPQPPHFARMAVSPGRGSCARPPCAIVAKCVKPRPLAASRTVLTISAVIAAALWQMSLYALSIVIGWRRAQTLPGEPRTVEKLDAQLVSTWAQYCVVGGLATFQQPLVDLSLGPMLRVQTQHQLKAIALLDTSKIPCKLTHHHLVTSSVFRLGCSQRQQVAK
jgi:hypothetical protein